MQPEIDQPYTPIFDTESTDWRTYLRSAYQLNVLPPISEADFGLIHRQIRAALGIPYDLVTPIHVSRIHDEVMLEVDSVPERDDTHSNPVTDELVGPADVAFANLHGVRPADIDPGMIPSTPYEGPQHFPIYDRRTGNLSGADPSIQNELRASEAASLGPIHTFRRAVDELRTYRVDFRSILTHNAIRDALGEAARFYETLPGSAVDWAPPDRLGAIIHSCLGTVSFDRHNMPESIADATARIKSSLASIAEYCDATVRVEEDDVDANKLRVFVDLGTSTREISVPIADAEME